MIQAAGRFRECGSAPPVCIVVHALAGAEVMTELLAVARQFVSTNAVPSAYAEIDLCPVVAEGVRSILASGIEAGEMDATGRRRMGEVALGCNRGPALRSRTGSVGCPRRGTTI